MYKSFDLALAKQGFPVARRTCLANQSCSALSMDKHTRQLNAFKRQMSPEKLKDFSKQYDDMLSACRSLVTSPQAPQTCEKATHGRTMRSR